MKKLSFKGDVAKKRKRPAQQTSSPAKKSAMDLHEDEEGWLDAQDLADISGPVLIAYNFDMPISLISDARGSLFTIPLDPIPASLSDAEPHDVRQVFVASAIVSRPAGTVSLKNGASARYMTSDRFGESKCDKDAIGPAEEWTFVKRPDGWVVQNVYDKYLSIDKVGHVRCDAEDIGFCETFRVRIQARTRQKRLKEAGPAVNAGKSLALLGKKDLETKCGRTLTIDEVKHLQTAQREGSLGEAILDMRVKGRSDKFG